MEARSLASLNYLAANPPQYPVNPTEEHQEPLTLYISRVPGTRDVILSPFKPQLKNVTGEDVASSLYYVHLDTSTSDSSGPFSLKQNHQQRSSDEGSPSRRAIPRKPIPGNGAGALHPDTLAAQGGRISFEQQMPPRSSADLYHHSLTYLAAPQGPRPEDSGVGFSESQPAPYSYASPVQSPNPIFPARKPVGGPRPLNETTNLGVHSKPLPTTPQEPFTSNERSYDFDYSSRPSTGRASYIELQGARAEPPSLLYPDDSSRLASQVYETDYSVQSPGRFSPGRYTRSPSPTPAKQKDFFTLNLIRRDPSSGNQWNVGKISSQHFDAGTSSAPEDGAHGLVRASSSISARPPIDVQLETSGYAKFRHMPNRRSMDTTGPHYAPPGHEDAAPVYGDVATFSRQVQMAYSKSWTSNLKDKWNRVEKVGTLGRQGHSRNQSTVSVSSVASTGSSPTTSLGHAVPGMKPRGYVFTSPWDGRCDFRTGNAGRSIRCHHILHDGPTSAYNPLVAQPHEASNFTGPASSVVSELRFNLPSSELFTPDDPSKRSGGHQRLGSLSKFWKRGDDDDDDDNEVSPFDVNLGKERAGGGNRGKRAKLGKLIIYNDGLKMLDLIVAANVGIWWGTWERSF